MFYFFLCHQNDQSFTLVCSLLLHSWWTEQRSSSRCRGRDPVRPNMRQTLRFLFLLLLLLFLFISVVPLLASCRQLHISAGTLSTYSTSVHSPHSLSSYARPLPRQFPPSQGSNPIFDYIFVICKPVPSMSSLTVQFCCIICCQVRLPVSVKHTHAKVFI